MLHFKICFCRIIILIETTIEPQEAISGNALVLDINEVKVEPEDFQNFNVSQSKGNEVTCNNSELLQYFDKSPENRTG